MSIKSSPNGIEVETGLPKCPFKVLTDGADAEHTVTDNGGGSYTCSCGRDFEWTSQTDYVRTVA